jgi:hypothetical protein
VGTTHRGLDRCLERASQTGTCRWDCVELFFLSEEALGRYAPLTSPTGLRITGLSLIGERTRSILEASARLAATARRWALYEYDEARIFGSWWDWDQPGGRICVSPCLWGEELQIGAGAELLWSHDPYELYARALATLRGLARPIAHGERPVG